MTIQTLLNIEYPILQGAMAKISRFELVSAVSNAGGLGILATGGMSAEEVSFQIKEVKKRTDKPYGVNLMLLMDNIPELVEIIIREQVPVVTTGAGTPKTYMPRLLAAGIKVIPIVSTVAIAQKMAAIGAHALIAEGSEAGGHIGETTTMALVPQVVRAVEIPVLAAGGIADGHGIAAAYALGAKGVQLGTLFLAAEECPISANYKQAILTANDTATAVSGRKIGIPVRSIQNKMTDQYRALEEANASREEFEKIGMGALHKAVYQGDMEHGSVMAGQISGLVREIEPVATMLARIYQEAQSVTRELRI